MTNLTEDDIRRLIVDVIRKAGIPIEDVLNIESLTKTYAEVYAKILQMNRIANTTIILIKDKEAQAQISPLEPAGDDETDTSTVLVKTEKFVIDPETKEYIRVSDLILRELEKML